MSWYDTEEDAAEACKWKEKEYGCKFHILKEFDQFTQKEIYWAQRKIPTEYL